MLPYLPIGCNKDLKPVAEPEVEVELPGRNSDSGKRTEAQEIRQLTRGGLVDQNRTER